MLRIYNTLTKRVEEFKPLHGNDVGFYSCGPTVYNFAHIGNFRSFIFYDLIKRYLKFRGYKVKHVMNITDVDDKTIRDSQKEGVSLKEFTELYTRYFLEDLKTLNIELPDVMPKATEHIEDMVALIKRLMDKGYAYKGEDGSIYYDVSKFKDYGKLSGIKLDELKSGARVKQDEYAKNQAQDFALWKAYSEKDGDVFWNTPLGKGRPGWHIECSAMSMKYLGESFDLHSGGIDLVFPHHENEIAQSEAATGKQFVKYWVHPEFLQVDGKKMSKSLGNFFTLRDLLKKGYDPMAIRYLLISTHYRQQLNFTMDGLKSAENTVNKLRDFMKQILLVSRPSPESKEVSDLIKDTEKKFIEKMDNDLNISEALAVLFKFVNSINKIILKGELSKVDAQKVKDFMLRIDSVLGLKLGDVQVNVVTSEQQVSLDEINALLSNINNENIEKLLAIRNYFRSRKNFKTADMIRDKLNKLGVKITDLKTGSHWEVKNQ